MKKFTLSMLITAFALLFVVQANAQTTTDTIDLTGFTDANVLADTLDGIPNGAVVLLKPGMTYNSNGAAFDSSVVIMSSDPLNLDRPKINCDVNFVFVENTKIDSIMFMNLELMGDYDGDYVINSNTAVDSIGRIVFNGCYIHNLRGIVRTKDAGPGLIDNFIIENCNVNRIRDYGILTIDMDNWKCNNIVLSNSTFSKTRGFLTSRNASISLMIDGCTLSEVPAAGQRLFRWRTSTADSIRDGIMVKNTLWGTGWDEGGTGDTSYDGYDGLSNTTWTFENTYVVSDLDIAVDKDSIEGFNFVYDGGSAGLWASTAADSLQIADTITFAGYGNAGDQRWAAVTENGGVEMSFSSGAFWNKGNITETTKIAGLTIHATSDKAVTIEGNNKTFDGRAFQQRLKLNGSGGFDEDGMPLNRVLTIELDHSATINVAAISASSTSDRILNIAAGHKDNLIGEHPALGVNPETYGSYEYKGGPTTIMLYSPSSGVNVYNITTDWLANNDSLLSSLSVSVSDLEPAFSPDVHAYTLLVPDGTTEVVVSGIAHDPNASVSDNDTVDVSGGSGTGTVICVAEDGVATTVYTVEITVDLPPPTPADITFIVDDSELRTSAGFALKGSWFTATGEYDPLWDGGAEHSDFFDDGTHGDETIGDNIWTVTIQLIPDGGANTWKWGVNDANGAWIDGDWEFTVADETAQTFEYVIEGGSAVESLSASRFTVYPNPASSVVHIGNAEEISRVEVVNFAGQQLMNVMNKGNSTLTISVDQFASGVYILRITGVDNAVGHQKLVIE